MYCNVYKSYVPIVYKKCSSCIIENDELPLYNIINKLNNNLSNEDFKIKSVIYYV